jgi:DNA polymerase-3 subunit delta
MVSGEFERHLEKQSEPCPVYLFIGEADFLIDEAWEKLTLRLSSPGAKRFKGERLHAKEVTAAQVLERAGTLPMFGARRLLMVEHVEVWPKEQRADLLSYLKHPCPSTCLVLTSPQKKGLSELEPAVGRAGKVIHFSNLTEKDAPRWLQERAMQRGKRLGGLAASFLVEQVGLDRSRLEGELEKISLYVGDRKNIEMEDLKQAVGSYRSFTVFELLQYVSRHRTAQAVTSLRNLMLSGEPPLIVLSLLARQVRIIWQVKDGLKQGLTGPEIGQKLKLPPFAMQNYIKQAADFLEQDLRRFHTMICETDLAMKSSGTAPELLLESLVLSLCQSPQRKASRAETRRH